MKDITLSIVIPVYNAEQYIGRCLDTICNKIDESIEVIVINDGSKDQSREILQKYQQQYGIILINQENAGVSVARNKGIEKASGQYITFVDADDLIYDDMIEDLQMQIQQGNKKDIFIYNYQDIDNKNQCIASQDVVNGIKSKADIEKAYILGHYFNTIWGKIYRTALIKNSNILFPEGMKIGEDAYWFGKILEKVETIYCSTLCAYGYRQNMDGAMVQLRRQLNQERIREMAVEITNKEQLAHNLSWNEQQMGDFYQRFADNIVAKVNFAIKGRNDKKELFETVAQFIANDTIKHILIEAMKSKYVDRKRRIICKVMLNGWLRALYLNVKSR